MLVSPSMNSLMMKMKTQPIKIAILAMGGEGGGVLADWIVSLAEAYGYFAQTTSVPGVAQRTGATIYYVELFPGADDPDAPAPVLALMPTAGDVDIVLASELMEAGRAVQRGFVTPDRTTLIASTHRAFTMQEKSAMGDGRVDSRRLIRQSQQAARCFIHFDMAQMAEKCGSVMSSVLFGALCGTGILPFSSIQFEQAIIRGGVGIKPSLQAFGLGLSRTQAALSGGQSAGCNPPSGHSDSAHKNDARHDIFVKHSSSNNGHSINNKPINHNDVNALLSRIEENLPSCIHKITLKAVRRLIDYQDPEYASLYLDRLQHLVSQVGESNQQLLREAARHLVLWMTYEDIIRVADLKTRASRFKRVHQEIRANRYQLVEINEFLHPRTEEICDTLPAGFGRWLSRPHTINRILTKLFSRGYVIKTSSIWGYLLLYMLAGLRRIRRCTLRFQRETTGIDNWLRRIVAAAKHDPVLAVEVVKCQQLLKGYGDTHSRGLKNFQTLMNFVDCHRKKLSAHNLRQLREAALADEDGRQLHEYQQYLEANILKKNGGGVSNEPA
ncbi:indolepyruvate oxidoreductase subunit beta family protein [Xenorhabdus sp. KJ12.1]|uniref:indolepyruvate oxidoreductase subunit beta family protein n=1 Tax=Xenorhabdus sp. KJ12.1 TaxID=1851571 RepID=UPI000C062770|nr:indolepyruvate oxidoreductase subunit beta family protein [Xenorhabdus sp. KJ12.1]PHM68876.1 indolepyruvate oxidoreductase subunit B [Xenorhabdus sp. KJ12.1]